MSWKRLDNSWFAFTPVHVPGDRLNERVSVAVDPTTSTVHLGLIGKHGDVTTTVLRPADVRRLGAALIEAGILAHPSES